LQNELKEIIFKICRN